MEAAFKRAKRAAAGTLLVLSACALSNPPAAVVVEESVRTEATALVVTDDRETTTPGDVAGSADDPTARQDSIDDPDDAPGGIDDSTEMTDEEVAELLAELQAAGFCDPADVEDEGVVTAMHFVVRGVIQDPCYIDPPGEGGEGDDNAVDEIVVDDDPRLLDAWNLLTEITPIELVDDISLIAGYEGCASCDTLALVTQLDEAATFFIVAVDVVAAVEDPDELRLTMMHELTHVFAQEPGEQLVVSESPSGCDTFFNGVGCFTEASYLWAWIDEFWPAEILDSLPVDGSVGDDNDAEQRCSTDPGYTGNYAAVHPEEDFAETFSAYVFDVDVDPALSAKMEFFDRYPEFVAIRENARAAGYAGTESNFEGCGL